MGHAEINEYMVDLATNPEFQPLLRSGSAVLLWRAAPLAILWASPAAEELAQALVADAAGTVSYDFPAHAQISALAEGSAPRGAHRLEKLRLEASNLAPGFTCAVQMLTLPDGEEVLFTSFLGMPPRLPPSMRKPVRVPQEAPIQATPDRAEAEADAGHGVHTIDAAPLAADQGEPSSDSDPVPTEPPVKQPKRIVRFVWEADAQGRFISVSDNLAEVVGSDSAAIAGMTINEVLATRAVDPLDIIAELFARGETWSGRKLYWRMGDTDEAVQIDLAGLAVHDQSRNLVGFRGFGLCRTDVLVPWSAPQAEPAKEAPCDDHGPTVFEVPAPAQPTVVGDEVVEQSQEPSPESGPEPVPEISNAAGAFLQVGGSVVARMGDAAPLPLKVVEEEFAPESAAPSMETASDADAIDPVIVDAALSDETRPAAALQEAAAQEAVSQEDVETSGPELESENLQRVEAPSHEATKAGHVESDSTSAEVASEAVEVQPPTLNGGPQSAVKPLSNAERSAFRDIAKALGARFEDDAGLAGPVVGEAATPELPEYDDAIEQSAPDRASEQEPLPDESFAGTPVIQQDNKADATSDATPDHATDAAAATVDIAGVLDRLPVGVIVHRDETALFANRALLDLIGYADLAAFVEDGGLSRLFQARPTALTHQALDVTAPLAVGTRKGDSIAVEVRLTSVDWGGSPASMLTLRKVAESDPDLRLRAMELDMAAREQRLREQSAILDTATDGVIVLDDRGRILSLNRAAEALFGYEQNEVAGEPLMMLLATDSHLAALDYLEGMRAEGMQSLLNDGREVIARVRQGGTIPLFMTLGRVGDGGERKFCAVLRDITAFKKAEGELIAAKRAAEHANAQKSDFLAKISHEIRTPLNAIIGFAEVMIEERFGAIGNERYKDYVSDIHSSGQHVISLVNDLLDLAKIEAGRMELTFTSVKVNELVTACVALLQPQAARDRIVLRTSFADKLPPVVADERSLRQITLNLLSNAVKFTDAGGQVIVSTAMTDAGEVVFRVRDTGIGMSETEVEAALEPFRQLATSRKGGGTGLGLPLTKALVEANRGALTIASRKNEGTLVEVVFPPTRVLAE